MDATTPAAPAEPAEDRSSILIVDDLSDKLLVFSTILEELGQNLVLVRSGRDALREVLQREFAVILLDVNMPDMDGFETAALIREYQKAAHTPIIFITAFADEMQTARGYSLGAVDYILSPVVPDVLRSKVRVFVSLHAMRRQIRRQADDRAAMLAAQAARDVAERNDRRSVFLSHASRTLGDSLDAGVAAERLAALVVPRLAPLALVVLHDAAGGFGTAVLASPAGLRRVRPDQLAPAVRGALDEGVRQQHALALPLAAGSPLDAASFGLGTGWPVPATSRSLLVTPLTAGERVLGVLLLADPAEADGQLLEGLAGRAGSALENARLYQSLQAEIVERRAAEAELQNANRLKDEFLAMLSHELRNPLAAIHSALELVRRSGSVAPGVTWATDVMHRQVHQMTRLVEELLDVARISQNKIVLARDSVDLKAVIAQSAEAAQPFLKERNQTLATALPPGAIWLSGDFARLTQILSNLLHNASKYSGKGALIELRCEVADGNALVAVRDHGIGIDAELLPRIFDLFTQGARGLDRSQGGLGVGLTLAMRLAQLHGGRIEALSEGPNRGAEFRLHLPCLQVVREPAAAAPAPAPSGPAVRRRVLLVDDNDDAALTLRTLLEMAGHEVRTVGDGLQAVAGAELFAPEVVILDIGLPGLNGYEVARRLRQMAALQGTLLVALTGYGQPQDLAAAREAGFDHHFVKPADPESLVACIAAHEPMRRQTRVGAAT